MRLNSMILAVCLFLSSISFMEKAIAAPENLGALLEPVREKHQLPALVAAVARGGKIVAAGAAGLRALGYTTTPATTRDRIHIGSDGKAMTSLIAGILVEEGRLRWDSTIGEVLGGRVPDINPKLAAVTLKQLLTHSSGIPSDTKEMEKIYFNPNAFDYNSWTLRLMALEAWKHNTPMIPKISPFQYANFGYMVAGAMIEEAASKPWEQLIRERLFEPLGLKTAGLGPTATPGLVDAIVGHLPQSDGTLEPRMWGNAADMPQLLGPAGTVHMSILDFARWGGWVAGKANRAPFLVKPSTLKYILTEKVRTPPRPNPLPGTPAEGGYAFGWSLEKFSWADKELLTHAGSNGMNVAKILVDVERDMAVVVATNAGGRPADLAATEIIRIVYDRFR